MNDESGIKSGVALSLTAQQVINGQSSKISALNELYKQAFGNAAALSMAALWLDLDQRAAEKAGFKTIEEHKAFLKKQTDVQEDLSDLLK